MPNTDTDNATYFLWPTTDPPRQLYGPDPVAATVGWDAGRATFFAHVYKEYPYIDGDSYLADAVRIGTAPYEVHTARTVLDLVRPWAVVPPGLERELEEVAGPHRARVATVWATNDQPGHGLPGRHVDLTEDADDDSVHQPARPDPGAPDWTVRTSRANVYGEPSPGAVISQHSGYTRDDALITAVRLATSGIAHDVAAFVGDDQVGSTQLAHWRYGSTLGWQTWGSVREQPELHNALDRAIARVADSTPAQLAAAAEQLGRQPTAAAVDAIAEAVWPQGYRSAYGDAHLDERWLLNTAARLALDDSPQALATLRCLWTRPESPDRLAPPVSADAVIAARHAATDREPAWRAAADAAWRVSRVAGRLDGARDAADDFLALWRSRGGEEAAAMVTINDRPAADVIPDLIRAVCAAPHTATNWTGHRWSMPLGVDQLAAHLLASISDRPRAADAGAPRPAAAHPAALAAAFHPPAAAPPRSSGQAPATASTSRHDRSTPHQSPSGWHGPAR